MDISRGPSIGGRDDRVLLEGEGSEAGEHVRGRRHADHHACSTTRDRYSAYIVIFTSVIKSEDPLRICFLGYSVAAYPLTLLSASVRAMSKSLELLKQQKSTDQMILPFQDLQTIVGFDEYNQFLDQY